MIRPAPRRRTMRAARHPDILRSCHDSVPLKVQMLQGAFVPLELDGFHTLFAPASPSAFSLAITRYFLERFFSAGCVSQFLRSHEFHRPRPAVLRLIKEKNRLRRYVKKSLLSGALVIRNVPSDSRWNERATEIYRRGQKVSDKFDDFLDRLEMPLSEPVIVTVADRVVDLQVACVRRTGALMEYTLRMAWPANASGGKSAS